HRQTLSSPNQSVVVHERGAFTNIQFSRTAPSPLKNLDMAPSCYNPGPMEPLSCTEPQAAPRGASALPSLAGLTRGELADRLRAQGLPEREIRMRVAQLWHWLYFRGTDGFCAMHNVAKSMRNQLADVFSLSLPEVFEEQVSQDGTRKWLLRFPPATAGDAPADVECVYIPESDRGTLCVSSQVGCTLNCTFCHTGTQRLVRNLTTAEIVGQ